MKRYTIIVNEKAGQGRARKLAKKVAGILRESKKDIKVLKTEKSQDAKVFTSKAKGTSDIIIVADGDGTIFEAINGMAPDFIPLGIIPGGTANVLAKELSLPRRAKSLTKMIIEGSFRNIDLGLINEKYFALMAGIGFDAKVISEVKPVMKQIFRKLAYPATGIKILLTYRNQEMDITLNNSIRKKAYFAVVSNASGYGGPFSLSAEADLTDGILDVSLFERGRVRDFVKYTLAVLTGRHPKLKDVKLLRAKKVEVDYKTELLVQADGEVIDKTPVKIEVKNKVLPVIISR